MQKRDRQTDKPTNGQTEEEAAATRKSTKTKRITFSTINVPYN